MQNEGVNPTTDPQRQARARLGITPITARRGKLHGSSLGCQCWFVERTIGWLHQFRRLRIR